MVIFIYKFINTNLAESMQCKFSMLFSFSQIYYHAFFCVNISFSLFIGVLDLRGGHVQNVHSLEVFNMSLHVNFFFFFFFWGGGGGGGRMSCCESCGIFSLILVCISPPKGSGPIPEVLQYRANPWGSRSKPLYLPPGSKISLISQTPNGGRIRY